MSARVAAGSWLALFALCLLWEMVLAPLHPHGSWLVLKAVPLLFALRGVLRKDVYTLQWASLLIWLYFTEGVVRATSDAVPASRWCATAEVALTIIFFTAAMIYLRPIKRAAKLKAASHGK